MNVLTTQDKLESVAQHIEMAACLIEESGWTRFSLFRDENNIRIEGFPHHDIRSFCIVGALYATSDDLKRIANGLPALESRQSYDAQCALAKFLGRHPSTWNDMRAKDKRDVVVHMLDCASWLRKKEGKKWFKGTVM